MKPSRRHTRKEFNQDKRSIERFASMREALGTEIPTSRTKRLGDSLIHFAHNAVDVVKQTLHEGRQADAESRLETANAHLEEGYSTEADLQALRENNQSVIIKTPWQR